MSKMTELPDILGSMAKRDIMILVAGFVARVSRSEIEDLKNEKYYNKKE